MSAQVIADSLHPDGRSRLTTMSLRVPTSVMAQLLTHRMFSRNAASMRAIPTDKVVADVLANPYVPAFLENRKGMRGGDVIRYPRLARFLWKSALYGTVGFIKCFQRLGLHKQVVNRLLAPWSHNQVLVTGNAGAWANFFHLRCHHDADPGISIVAEAAKAAYLTSTPRQLAYGEWHMPYADNLKQSVARCARVSYNMSGVARESEYEEDSQLVHRLIGSQPMHASPTEHQALAVERHRSNGGNLGKGWRQLRKTLKGEYHDQL